MTGAGMGLSTVKHIIELLGGDMTISSKQNVGTQVTIGLPIKGDIQI
jgi:signal transduction histidine kinase